MQQNTLKDIELFQNILKLKYTYRYSGRTFNGEKESTADHTWCMFVIADYLLEKLNKICPGRYNLDKLKIYEMIVYHDLIEAETGDVDLDPSASELHKTKEQIEKDAFPIFLEKIPKELRKIYQEKLEEYEKRETLESKFVKLVDVIEAEYQSTFYKYLRKNWNREFYIQKREKYHNYFPELKFIFLDMLDYLDKNNYFKKD